MVNNFLPRHCGCGRSSGAVLADRTAGSELTQYAVDRIRTAFVCILATL
jgi:hypothetical protein